MSPHNTRLPRHRLLFLLTTLYFRNFSPDRTAKPLPQHTGCSGLARTGGCRAEDRSPPAPPAWGCGTGMGMQHRDAPCQPRGEAAPHPCPRDFGSGTAGRVAERSKTDPGSGLPHPPAGIILSPRGERLKFRPPRTKHRSLGSSSLSTRGTPASASRSSVSASRAPAAPGPAGLRARCRCRGAPRSAPDLKLGRTPRLWGAALPRAARPGPRTPPPPRGQVWELNSFIKGVFMRN